MDQFHPGQVLARFMSERGLSTYKLAAGLNVVHSTVFDIANERRGISAEMALRLGKFFRNKPEYWLELQNRYDLNRARKKLQIEDCCVDSKFNGCDDAAVDGTAFDGTTFNGTTFEGNAFDTDNENAKDWKEPIRKSEFVSEDGIEDVFRVYEKLGTEPVSFDTLASELELMAGQLAAILVSLELSLLVKRLPGDRYIRARSPL